MDNFKRLKIGYISAKNPLNRRLWSGIPYYMFKMLEKHCGDVTYLGEVNTPLMFLGKATNGILSLIKKRYNYGHCKLLASIYKKEIERQLHGKQFDILFTQATTESAFLKTDIPIVLATDATLSGLVNYYAYYSNFLKFSVRESLQVEGAAFKNSTLLLLSSEWAAKHAVENYNVPADKVKVLNLGANLENIPDRRDVLSRKKNNEKCKLLFIGVEWERKGGPIAFDTLIELRRLGVNAELTICGVIPPKQYKHEHMKYLPYLDKKDPNTQNIMRELYLDADFFLLPTRAESYGIVFSEASAFGLPIISTNTGGVPTVVVTGINGYLLSLEATAKEYADTIVSLYNDRVGYEQLRISARDFFEQKLNWDVWGKNVRKHIYDTIGI